MPFPKSTTSDQVRVPCAVHFTAAAIAFRDAVKAVADQHLEPPNGFGVPAGICYGLPGADAEVRRALDNARTRYPADLCDLQHYFGWSAAGLDHLIEPRARS